MVKKEGNKTLVIVVVILLILLIGTISYIVFEKYQKIRDEKNKTLLQQGFDKGYQFAILQVMRSVSTCNQVPLIYENSTINVIAVECLKQKQQTPNVNADVTLNQ